MEEFYKFWISVTSIIAIYNLILFFFDLISFKVFYKSQIVIISLMFFLISILFAHEHGVSVGKKFESQIEAESKEIIN